MRSRFLSIAVAVVALAALFSTPALAEPPSNGFGPAIEGYLGYEGQSRCSPAAKPGVLSFRAMVLRAYPGTGAGGIGRACSVGGQSEHKEGRAWDWGVNVAVPYQKAAAESLIDWLLAPDRYGNEAAMAKRLGIMYLIWNRKIWGTWGGWSRYCVPRPAGCMDPDGGGGARSPHTDHVHISFTWEGALKKTTFWNKDRSFLTSFVAAPTGYLMLGRNGSVITAGSDYYSSPENIIKQPMVGLAASPSGWGYLVASKDGKVRAYGDAKFRGAAKGETSQLAGIAAMPSGKGYWLYARGGSVFPRGHAADLGGLGKGSGVVTGMAVTATGLGYWMVTRDGTVTAFGDAIHYGDEAGEMKNVAGIVRTVTGLGYWIYTKTGRVVAFGDAAFYGGLADTKLTQDIVGLAPSATGLGYVLLGSMGKLKSFGDAPKLKIAGAGSTFPAGLTPQLLPGD